MVRMGSESLRLLIALVITGAQVPAELPDQMLSTITAMECRSRGAVAGRSSGGAGAGCSSGKGKMREKCIFAERIRRRGCRAECA